jgi:hypothetical protein
VGAAFEGAATSSGSRERHREFQVPSGSRLTPCGDVEESTGGIIDARVLGFGLDDMLAMPIE